MDKSDILVSAIRYLHARYDIELDDASPRIVSLLKHYVNNLQDETLIGYWEDYNNVTAVDASGEHKPSVKGPDTTVIDENPAGKTVYYRGVAQTITPDAADTMADEEKPAMTYRGTKV